MGSVTDNEIMEWMDLFLVYRNHGKATLTKAEYDRFAELTKKMSGLLRDIGV